MLGRLPAPTAAGPEGTWRAADLERAAGRPLPEAQAPPPDALATLVGRLTQHGEAGRPADRRPPERGSGDPPPARPGQPDPVTTDRGPERSASERRADFIAAARRAAQAGTPEGGVAGGADQRLAEQRQSAFARIGRAIRNRKRTLLLAAAAVVVAGGAWHVLGWPPPVRENAIDGLVREDVAFSAGTPKSPLVEDAAPARPAARAGESALVAPPSGAGTIAFASPEAVGSHFGGTFQAPQSGSFSATKADEGGNALPASAFGDTAVPSSAPQVLAAAIGSESLRAAVTAGDPAAFFEVATRYAEGRGVGQDLAAAVEWYRRAAEGELALAQYHLGSAYERGQGVATDMAAAAAWYERAADQGNVGAMYNLAVLTIEGTAGQPDREKALRWFRSAADFGLKDSQYNLGIIQSSGPAAERDLAEAYKWFAVAAAQGDTDAAARRDEIAGILMPDQLAAARAAAEAWRPKRVVPEANTVPVPPGGWDGGSAGISEADQRALVMKIQALLTERGYDPGPADGLEGPKTREAVRAFQRMIGAEETGSIDGSLFAALADRSG